MQNFRKTNIYTNYYDSSNTWAYLGLRSVSFSDFFAYVPKFALIVSSDDFTEKFIVKFGKKFIRSGWIR